MLYYLVNQRDWAELTEQSRFPHVHIAHKPMCLSSLHLLLL